MKRPPRIDRATPDAINAALQVMAHDLPRLVSCGRIDISASGEFVVPHKLGTTPEFYVVNPWSAIDITASEDNRTKWTAEAIVLTSSGSGTVTLLVGAL